VNPPPPPTPDDSPAHRPDGAHTECTFVTGVMRSGTTLLQRVVAHSLATAYIRAESTLRIPVESFHTLEHHGAFAPLGREQYLAHYQRFISGLLQALACTAGGGELVLKDPLALKILDAFHALMPRSRFIISIRDPRATAASIYRVRNRQRAQGKTSFITPMDFGDIVEYIGRLCDTIMRLQAHENVCLVQYEKLVGQDQGELARLSRFLGVPVQLDIPDDSSSYTDEHAFWTAEAGTQIRATALTKHREELSAADAALVASRLARFNSLFGYA
jgi:hypothetical protein